MRSTLKRLAIGVAALVIAAPALGQEWPQRAVRIVNPFPPGGTSDTSLRVITQHLGEMWKQPIVLETKTGAAGAIGTMEAVKAPPDGYLLTLGSVQTNTTNRLLNPKLSYDPDKDLTPIVLLATSPVYLIVNMKIPATSAKEFVEYVKANPGKLNYGTPGPGSPQHLAAELLRQRLGLSYTHVTYRGAAPVVLDLLSGNIQFTLDTTAMQNVQQGQLRALAIAHSTRFPGSDLPTFAEAGFPGIEVAGYFCLNGPAGLPASIVNKVAEDTKKVLAMPDVRQRFLGWFLIPDGRSGADLKAYFENQRNVLGEVIRVGGIKTD